ncbi:hypothetical protein [Idiomarina sp. HP20-50]|uniref:hypothetical protein n=1 Tax=Idiomarina sp. HP20-50 TaxID=3070813 RepID=UPI00294B3EDB|nr:hypothetical protein [Idiomarina sp. HP20-50]MDV6315728.1 hypothetical protein [Idiomarina sp. HP20-50]
MKKVIFFLLLCLILILVGFIKIELSSLPEYLLSAELAIRCGMISALGGVLYCLRSVYLNRCVRNRWSTEWEVWYYLRPITSSICGVVAYLFLKAGLIILNASDVASGEGHFGYLALAFLAGLNVDKFVERIEEVGKSIFGIDKSRNAKNSSKEDPE